jgi:hypothetical protein
MRWKGWVTREKSGLRSLPLVALEAEPLGIHERDGGPKESFGLKVIFWKIMHYRGDSVGGSG